METPANSTAPSSAGLNARHWTIIVLGVALFAMLTYTRLTQTARNEINRVPASVTIKELDRVVPAFSLTDTAGGTVTESQMLGRPTLYYFFFSTCPGICPIMNNNAKKLRDALPKDSPLRIVGISVNPETDTPEVLQRYGLRFNADPANWLMLTGDRQAIFDLSAKGFLLSALPAAPEDIPTSGPVIHSERFVLVDKNGRIIQYFDGLKDTFASDVQTALKVHNLDH